jgi:nicotinamide-nucleotide amidase
MPRVAARLGQARVVRARLLRTFGIGESNLDRILHDVAQNDSDAVLGFRTQFPDNLVRILVRAADESDAQRRLDELEREIRVRLGDLVLGAGERELEEIVAELLREQKLTIAVAESLTGGLVTSRLTDVPGSPRIARLLRCVCGRRKLRELGVDQEALLTRSCVGVVPDGGGARRRAGTDLGLATTGIAGQMEARRKAGRTLWLACRRERNDRAPLPDDDGRRRNKELASQLALDWVRRRLLGLAITADLFPRLASAPGPRE